MHNFTKSYLKSRITFFAASRCFEELSAWNSVLSLDVTQPMIGQFQSGHWMTSSCQHVAQSSATHSTISAINLIRRVEERDSTPTLGSDHKKERVEIISPSHGFFILPPLVCSIPLRWQNFVVKTGDGQELSRAKRIANMAEKKTIVWSVTPSSPSFLWKEICELK